MKLNRDQTSLLYNLHRLGVKLPPGIEHDPGASRQAIIADASSSSRGVSNGEPFIALNILGRMAGLTDYELMVALAEYRHGDPAMYQGPWAPEGDVATTAPAGQLPSARLCVELRDTDPPLLGARFDLKLPGSADKTFIETSGVCADMLDPSRQTMRFA